MIVVAGMPRSGNNLTRDTILMALEHARRLDPARPHEKVIIWHGNQRRPLDIERTVNKQERVAFVIPVRNPRCQRISFLQHFPHMIDDFPEDECRRAVFTTIAHWSFPVKLISYEAFVEDPEAIVGNLMEWLGLPWNGYPKKDYIYNGNAKYS